VEEEVEAASHTVPDPRDASPLKAGVGNVPHTLEDFGLREEGVREGRRETWGGDEGGSYRTGIR
jgi:hypothetical protein